MNTLPVEEIRTHLIGDALRARWLVVLLTAAVVVVGVGFVALRSTKHYESTASVFLQPIAGNPLSPDATANGQQVTVAMETEAGLVDSPGVVQLVGKALGQSEQDLRSNVSASVPSNTKIVQIGFSANTPKAARAGAQSFAESFLSFRQSLAVDAQNTQLTKLRAQAQAATTSLDKLAASTGTSANARRQILISQLAGLQINIGELDASDVHPGSVSSVATLPTKPTGIDPSLLIAAALVLGLGLGAVGAVIREVTDDTVRASWAASIAGLPVLSQVRARRRAGVPLLDPDGEHEEVFDAFRRLRIGVLATSPEACTIGICHAVPGRDGVIPVANLGLVMSRVGLRTVLVDATGGDALVAALGGSMVGNPTDPGGARMKTSGDQDLVVMSATQPDGIGIDEKRFSRIVENQRKAVDYVLIAAPSLTTADGEVAAMAADTMLLVVEQGSTRRRDLELLVEHAGVLGVDLCGVLSVPRQRGHTRGAGQAPVARMSRLVRGMRRKFGTGVHALRSIGGRTVVTEDRG